MKCLYCNETLEPVGNSEYEYFCPSCGANLDLDDLR